MKDFKFLRTYDYPRHEIIAKAYALGLRVLPSVERQSGQNAFICRSGDFFAVSSESRTYQKITETTTEGNFIKLRPVSKRQRIRAAKRFVNWYKQRPISERMDMTYFRDKGISDDAKQILILLWGESVLHPNVNRIFKRWRSRLN